MDEVADAQDSLIIDPTLIAFQENMKTKTYHPKNENYLFANVVLLLPSNLLGDDKPEISDAENFFPMQNELNTDLVDCNLVYLITFLK